MTSPEFDIKPLFLTLMDLTWFSNDILCTVGGLDSAGPLLHLRFTSCKSVSCVIYHCLSSDEIQDPGEQYPPLCFCSCPPNNRSRCSHITHTVLLNVICPFRNTDTFIFNSNESFLETNVGRRKDISISVSAHSK